MQRALSSIVRRSLLQRTRSGVASSPSALLVAVKPSSSTPTLRQFSVSSIKRDDRFASQDGESSSSSFPSLSGEGSAAAPSSRPAFGRPQRPDAKTGVFVGGLDPNTRDEDLKRVLAQFGEVVDANVVMDRDTQRSKRFGFVYFSSTEPVEKLIEDESQLDKLTELGMAPGIERISRPEGSIRGQDRPGRSSTFEKNNTPPSDTIFIAGFPKDMTRAQIEECLTEFYPATGIVKDFRVPVNRIERMETAEGEAAPLNRGYGFLRLGNEEEAQQTLEALTDAANNGFVFPGTDRPPLFRYASPQKPAGGRENGGRGGFNSFGGERRGGSRFGGERQQRRTTNNSWLNEERSRFQGGRGDDY